MINEQNGVLAVSGPMTVDTASGLIREGEALVVTQNRTFDFSAVEQVDSSAVAVVLDWIRQAKAAGFKLVLVNVPAAFVSLVKLYGVDELLAPHLPAHEITASGQ